MYDVIVVGARCAGSPTAMLLARKAYKVLLLDRSSFPSDTLSTHVIWPPGVACLKRWAVLDKVVESNCRPFTQMSLDTGAIVLAGSPPPSDGVRTILCPRRKVLDNILVDAAVAAGAELRTDFAVEELKLDGDRVTGIRGHAKRGVAVAERARVVVGRRRSAFIGSARDSSSALQRAPRPLVLLLLLLEWSADR